jgi:hypothetical protein
MQKIFWVSVTVNWYESVKMMKTLRKFMSLTLQFEQNPIFFIFLSEASFYGSCSCVFQRAGQIQLLKGFHREEGGASHTELD